MSWVIAQLDKIITGKVLWVLMWGRPETFWSLELSCSLLLEKGIVEMDLNLLLEILSLI